MHCQVGEFHLDLSQQEHQNAINLVFQYGLERLDGVSSPLVLRPI